MWYYWRMNSRMNEVFKKKEYERYWFAGGLSSNYYRVLKGRCRAKCCVYLEVVKYCLEKLLDREFKLIRVESLGCRPPPHQRKSVQCFIQVLVPHRTAHAFFA